MARSENPEKPLKVVMLGPDPQGHGGMQTVISHVREADFGPEISLRTISTFEGGGSLAKLRSALSALAKFVLALLGRDVDIVHIMITIDGSFWRKSVFAAASRAWRKPYILHVHRDSFIDYVESGTTLRRSLGSWLFACSSGVVVLGESLVSEVERLSPGCAVAVIRNGVPVPESRDTPRGNLTVVCLGGKLGSRKGTPELIEAFRRVSHENDRLVLGGATEDETAKILNDRPGRGGQIVARAWLTSAERDSLLQQATLFALPSYSEGLPMAMLEAMAAGVPVIATRVGAIGEVISNDRNGLLIEPGSIEQLADAIRRVSGNPELAERLGRAGRDSIVSDFSTDRVVASLRALWIATASTDPSMD